MQYVHTLICADPEFAPTAGTIAEFFQTLVTSFGFRIVINPPFQSGFMVLKQSDRLRTYTDPMTGEINSFPALDRSIAGAIADIPALIEDLSFYSASAWGEWSQAVSPLIMLTGDGKPFEGDPICKVSCELRPAPVSTSFWGVLEPSPITNVPQFDEPCPEPYAIGVFSHPWTGRPIRVKDAGRSRFRIEFQFGKLLAPKMKDSLELLPQSLLVEIQKCFERDFAQGYHLI